MWRGLATAGLALLFSGCTSIGSLYPQFQTQTAGIKAVAVTSDVLVLEDVKGPLPLVDVPRDLQLAAALNAYFQRELTARGFTVSGATTAAVGLHRAINVTPEILVRTAADSPALPLAELGKGKAPYHLAPAFAADDRRRLLQTALDDLYRAPPKTPQNTANPVSAAVRALGGEDAATHRLLVLVEGVQIPMGKGLMQAMGTGLLTLGTVSVFEMTTVKFRVGLADIATGEFILLLDCSLQGGWTVDDKYLQRQAGIFFAQLDRLRGTAGAARK